MRVALFGNLDWAFLNGVSLADAWAGPGTIPVVLFFVYQMMFAVITPALITGAFTNRDPLWPLPYVLGPVAASRLLPICSHDLGRRSPCRMGSP